MDLITLPCLVDPLLLLKKFLHCKLCTNCIKNNITRLLLADQKKSCASTCCACWSASGLLCTTIRMATARGRGVCVRMRDREKQMETVGVFGGAARPYVLTSSVLGSSTDGTCRAPNAVSCKNVTKLSTSHLAAFPSPSHVFSYFPSRLHGSKTPRKSTKTHIFLPHLVASMEQVEETYIMVKPDGVQRGLVGEIISRFEKKGFKLIGLKLFQCPEELAEEHYKDLKSRSFFPKLINYITSGPVVCMAWEGVRVVASARKLIGSTDPLQAEPGTIRGDLAVQTGRNVVHGSDSSENGKREIALWFKEGELCQWTPAQAPWLRE